MSSSASAISIPQAADSQHRLPVHRGLATTPPSAHPSPHFADLVHSLFNAYRTRRGSDSSSSRSGHDTPITERPEFGTHN